MLLSLCAMSARARRCCTHAATTDPHARSLAALSLDGRHSRGGGALSPSMAALVLFGVFFFLMALRVPIAFALGLACLPVMLYEPRLSPMILFNETFKSYNSFILLAVPFFILAAELMSGGSLTEVLLRFASQFVGHRRGGLGHANVLSLTLFSGISGSALADAAGPGAMLIRMMDKAGYARSYAAALTASTAIIGPIIPPSIIMIIYALQDERVTPLGLFMAGILPGLLIAAAMMASTTHVPQ